MYVFSFISLSSFLIFNYRNIILLPPSPITHVWMENQDSIALWGLKMQKWTLNEMGRIEKNQLNAYI